MRPDGTWNRCTAEGCNARCAPKYDRCARHRPAKKYSGRSTPEQDQRNTERKRRARVLAGLAAGWEAA